MSKPIDDFKPGQRVVVMQQIAQRERTWSIRVQGEVVRSERQKTGAWFAHSKDDKLWLDRLVIKKDDGEMVVVNLDPYTRVEMLKDVAATPHAAADTAEASGGE